MPKSSVLKQFYEKTVTDITAYGVDEFDFTPNLLGIDFSVGQFGYTVFTFGESNLYISTDGLSDDVPLRNSIYELPVDERVRDYFVGAVLESVEYDGEHYWIQFKGFDLLRGRYVLKDGHTDRTYFELEFPWI